MTAPRWQDVPEEARESVRMWLGSMRRAQADVRDDARFTSHARQTADDDVRAIDAALARLAEPERGAEEERQDVVAFFSRRVAKWKGESGPLAKAAAYIYDEAASAIEQGAHVPPGRTTTAAERWRAVPAHAREAMIAELETDCDELASAFGVNSAGKPWADHAAATAALLALAREAEGGR